MNLVSKTLLVLLALCSILWTAIALVVANAIVPGFELTVPTGIALALAIYLIQSAIGLFILPRWLGFFIRRSLSQANATNRAALGFQTLLTSLLSSAIGFGTLVVLLWLASQISANIRTSDEYALLYAAAILFLVPLTLNEEVLPNKSNEEKIRPIWQTGLDAMVRIVTWPVLPFCLSWLSRFSFLGLAATTPLKAAIAWVVWRAIAFVFRSLWGAYKSLLESLSARPELHQIQSPANDRVPRFAYILFLFGLGLEFVSIWLSDRIVPDFAILHVGGLLTFFIVSLVAGTLSSFVVDAIDGAIEALN